MEAGWLAVTYPTASTPSWKEVDPFSGNPKTTGSACAWTLGGLREAV